MREYNTIFDEFIQFKHFLGYKYKTDEIVINEIKNYLIENNIAKITKISPFSAVTFFIYQNFPETNCENDFFITFTDFLAKSFELTVYSYNPTYS